MGLASRQTALAIGQSGLAGLLLYLSSPAVGAWPVTFVALVPLFAALRTCGVGAGCAFGAATGITFALPAYWWVVEGIGPLADLTPFASCLVWFAAATWQGGAFAGVGLVTAVLRRRGWSLAPAFAAAMMIVELTYPFIFPTHLAGFIHPAIPLLQVADLGGPIAVTLVITAINLLVFELLNDRKHGFDRPRLTRVCVAGMATAAALLYGLGRVRQLEHRAVSGSRIKVAIVQGNARPTNVREARASLRRQVELTWRARRELAPDLVVWSETVLTEPVDGNDASRQLRSRFTSLLGVPALFGAIVRDTDERGTSADFNSALLTSSSGELVGRYDKRNLVVLGEYLPLERRFSVLRKWFPGAGNLHVGGARERLVLAQGEIAPLICYEDMLASYVAATVRPAPVVLVTLTNDGWFAGTAEPRDHFAYAKLRAIETRRYLVRAASTGVSAIVDPIGRVVIAAPENVATVIGGEVELLDGATVYSRVGNAPWLVLSALSIASVIVRSRRES